MILLNWKRVSYCFHWSTHVLHQMYKWKCNVRDNSIFKLLGFIVFRTENINRSSFVYCLFTICAVLSVSNVKHLLPIFFLKMCYDKYNSLRILYFMIIYENKLHLLFMSHHFVAGNRMLTLSMYAIKSWLTLLCGQFLDLLYVL